MVFQYLYFWLGLLNELKDRDNYSTAVFNALKYTRDLTVPKCDNLTSNRPSLLFVSKSRSPRPSLNKGGTINLLKSPRIPLDLGGDRLESQRHLLGVSLARGRGLTRPLSSPVSVLQSTENRSVSVGIYLLLFSGYLCL